MQYNLICVKSAI